MLVLKQNDYPANFICNTSAPPTQETVDMNSHNEEQDEERGLLVVIPYVAGMSENRMGPFSKYTMQRTDYIKTDKPSRGTLLRVHQDTDYIIEMDEPSPAAGTLLRVHQGTGYIETEKPPPGTLGVQQREDYTKKKQNRLHKDRQTIIPLGL